MEDAPNLAVSKLDELTGGNLGPHVKKNWAFCFSCNDHGGAGNAWATLSDEERQAVKEWMQRIGQRRGAR
ncbi:hypothetical protein WMF37_01625 [Sorangium sp. So ce291]|uniref:hypothetical protein n=1 Tax=Sorangium sp. So ce291 TaxID=3133294 RepID=UPI003F6149D1